MVPFFLIPCCKDFPNAMQMDSELDEILELDLVYMTWSKGSKTVCKTTKFPYRPYITLKPAAT